MTRGVLIRLLPYLFPEKPLINFLKEYRSGEFIKRIVAKWAPFFL
jgi:hypothetical protein